MNSGANSAQAAEKAFGDVRKLESEVNAYLARGSLPGALVRPPDYAPPTVTMRRLSADEEAIMPIRVRSEAGVTRKKAKDVAADARAVAARFPKSYAVQLALTEAEFDAENLEAAEGAADAALAIRPEGINALLFKAKICLERARKDSKQNAVARIFLARAHKADREHPEVLYLNYLSYLQEGGKLPESAIIGLEQSFTKAPYDYKLRLAVARQLLAERDGAVARKILAPLVHSPHESKGAKALRDIFDLIEANKVDEAYEGLVAEMAKQEEERKNGKERD
jgi:hypothetical protein